MNRIVQCVTNYLFSRIIEGENIQLCTINNKVGTYQNIRILLSSLLHGLSIKQSDLF